MHIARCKLSSASPYGQSRYFRDKKTRDETHSEFEERIWRERMHYNKDGECFIPPMQFKNCLSEAAKYKSIQIPGKGKQTYTKHIVGSVLVVEPLMLGFQKDDVDGVWLHLPSDGRRGGTTRVEKCMPCFQKWSGTVEFSVGDAIISEEVFTDHLVDAGKFIGIGFFRPANNGYWGRFNVDKVDWIEDSKKAAAKN